jgi:hypothetical protein
MINRQVNYITILIKVTNQKVNLIIYANKYIWHKKLKREDETYGTKSEGYPGKILYNR